MLKISIEVNENEGVLTVQTTRKTYVEKRKIVDFNITKLVDGEKTIIEQMEEDSMNEDFIEQLSEALSDDCLLHELMIVAYDWQ